MTDLRRAEEAVIEAAMRWHLLQERLNGFEDPTSHEADMVTEESKTALIAVDRACRQLAKLRASQEGRCGHDNQVTCSICRPAPTPPAEEAKPGEGRLYHRGYESIGSDKWTPCRCEAGHDHPVTREAKP